MTDAYNMGILYQQLKDFYESRLELNRYQEAGLRVEIRKMYKERQNAFAFKPNRSAWVDYHCSEFSVNMYIRVTTTSLIIANIQAEPAGKGAMKLVHEALCKLSKDDGLTVGFESVINSRLGGWLSRHGYESLYVNGMQYMIYNGQPLPEQGKSNGKIERISNNYIPNFA